MTLMFIQPKQKFGNKAESCDKLTQCSTEITPKQNRRRIIELNYNKKNVEPKTIKLRSNHKNEFVEKQKSFSSQTINNENKLKKPHTHTFKY